MERTYIAENDIERARLCRLVASLSDEMMARDVGHGGWTVTVTLAHLAFWDKNQLEKLEEAERIGEIKQFAGPVGWGDRMNDGMLTWWLNMSPIQVKYNVVTTAQEVDGKLAMLPEWLVQAVLSTRPRTIIRAVHRREHIEEIERVIKS
jgi:hypothetical protein